MVSDVREVPIPRENLGAFLGTKGAFAEELRQEIGCKMRVETATEYADGNARVILGPGQPELLERGQGQAALPPPLESCRGRQSREPPRPCSA